MEGNQEIFHVVDEIIREHGILPVITACVEIWETDNDFGDVDTQKKVKDALKKFRKKLANLIDEEV